MTNAEKYQEVFGMEPETKSCPTHVCLECPCCKNVEGKNICSLDTRAWWQDDYTGRPKGKWLCDEKYLDCKCSICNSYALERGDYPELSKYCPQCGAEMEVEINENND